MNELTINKQAKLSDHLASPSTAALSHSSELNGLRLSPHFTLGELTKTKHVTADGNIPSHAVIDNLLNLCWWLEELRYSYNTLYCLQPGEDYETSKNVEGIVINSGYRSPAVNKLAGGAATSNHVTGCAVDIRCAGKEQMIRYATILLDIADSAKRDLTYSRVCSHSAEPMQASRCARSTADFDELLFEQRGNVCWLHFAVRPPSQQNRRKVAFIKA